VTLGGARRLGFRGRILWIRPLQTNGLTGSHRPGGMFAARPRTVTPRRTFRTGRLWNSV
jgi:hypothetical protein